MTDVSCRACGPIVDVFRARGLPVDDLVRGLPFTLEDLADQSERVRWDPYTTFLERAATALGGPEEIEKLGVQHSDDSALGLVRALAGSFVSVRTLYTLGARWYGPSIFSNTRAECHTLPGNRIHQTVEILPPHRDSPTFFYLIRGILRSTPSLFGLPNADVTMTLSRRRADYTITPPRQGRSWRRLWRTEADPATVESAIRELAFQQAQLEDGYRRAENARTRLSDQSRRLEILNRLGRQLTSHLDVTELAQEVMAVLAGSAEVSGAAIWVVRRDDEQLELVGSIGSRGAEPTRRHDLRTGDQRVGRLDVWHDDRTTEGREMVELLLPWITLALANAHSFRALSEQARRLEAESTERRHAEQNLFRAQKMEAVGRLAGGLSHDFNNVLMAISGYAELARANLDDPDSVASDLAEISSEIERASSLIKQIQSFSRPQLLAPRHVDLRRVTLEFERVLSRLAGESIDLEIATTARPVVILADRGQIEQILINLVTNCRDAMPRGGKILISIDAVEIETDDPAEVSTGPLAPFALLEVRDTGTGMDADMRLRAFEPFVTSKPLGKGTGLGLSSVYGIVTQSGGSVDIASEVGHGTSVTIHMPRVDAETAEADATRLDGAIDGHGETVLVVEDEARVRQVTRRILETHGYRVLESSNGADALEICATHTGPIDVLLTDVVMPGLDGRALAREVATRRPDIRTLYMSGHTGTEPGSEDKLPREHAFVRKPFSVDEVLGALRNLLIATP